SCCFEIKNGRNYRTEKNGHAHKTGHSITQMRQCGQSFHRRILYAVIGMISSLIGNSDAFPILRQWDFFNHAGVCPLPRVAADALRKYAQQAEEVAYVETGWYRDTEKL